MNNFKDSHQKNKKRISKKSIFIIMLLIIAITLAGNALINKNGWDKIFKMIKGENSDFNGSNGAKIIKSELIESPDYKEDTPGDWHIDKTATWVSEGMAQIKFDVKTNLKYRPEYDSRDVLLVLDNSASMGDEQKLLKLKEDAHVLVDKLLTDTDNTVGLITFCGTSSIVSEFSKDKEVLLNKIDNLVLGSSTNYYDAYLDIEKVISKYTPQPKRDAVIVFLTDGKPVENKNLQNGVYAKIKANYPWFTIDGIQYGGLAKDEFGFNWISKELKDVTDKQWAADKVSLYEDLFQASYRPVTYEKFEVVDFIANDYFDVKSVDDIRVSEGKVRLEEENGKQKIIWTIDDLVTGRNPKMLINVKLKSELLTKSGIYSTNDGETVDYKLENDEEIKIESPYTPKLQSHYKVFYDTNMPKGMQSQTTYEEHRVFEVVKKSSTVPTCEGYVFKGWQIIEDVKKVNDEMFIMPGKDIHLKAVWTKFDLILKMDGTIRDVSGGTFFEDGLTLNAKIKKIAGNRTNGKYDDDAYIYHIEYSDTIPAEYMTDDNTVSTSDSVEKVYMWYNADSKTLFWTSKAEKIYFNVDSQFALYGLKNIESLDFSKWDTSKVENMTYFFGDCQKLANLDFDKISTANLKKASYLFSRNYALTEFDFSKIDVSNLTIANSMFENSSLTNVQMDNITFPNLENFAGAFWGCGLENVVLKNVNMPKVTTLSQFFNQCYNVKTIKFENCNLPELQNLYGLCNNCSKLESIDLSGAKTADKLEYTNGMFYKCSSLTSFDLTGLDYTNVKTLNQMFYQCTKLKNVELSIESSKLNDLMNLFYGCSILETAELNIKNTGTETINMNSMFRNCAKLTNYELNFDNCKPNDVQYMFSGCNVLANVNLDLDFSEVTNAVYMFANSYNISTITMNFNFNKATDMSSMFNNCQKLTKISVPDAIDISKVTKSSNMFYNCYLLVGGAGTAYDSGLKDVSMAKIDGGTADTKGYFSKKEGI